LFLYHSNKVLNISKSPVTFLKDLFCLLGADSSDSSGKDGLGDRGGSTIATFCIDGPAQSTWRRRGSGKAFLHSLLAVSCHVENHGKSSRSINDWETHDEVIHERCGVRAKVIQKDSILGCIEKDGEFPSDSSGVKDSKEGVSQPEERVGGFLGSISSNKSSNIKGVTRNLNEGP
jgi:hypothetical protein